MTNIPEEKLRALLHESERLPAILRDDGFWDRLERLRPENIGAAVQERFFRALPENESPLLIELWAAQGACVAELIERHGPSRARQELEATRH